MGGESHSRDAIWSPTRCVQSRAGDVEMTKIRLVLATLLVFSLACTGGDATTVTVNLDGAGGLEVGQPVRLNGIDIGSVSSVGFQDDSDALAAELDISNEGISRLDPNTLFVVMRNPDGEPSHYMAASNLCLDHPVGLAEGAVLDGYSGPMAKVILQASRDRPQCATALIEKLVLDLQTVSSQLEAQ